MKFECCWGSTNAEALGNAGHSFVAVAPRSTLARSGSTCHEDAKPGGFITDFFRKNCLTVSVGYLKQILNTIDASRNKNDSNLSSVNGFDSHWSGIFQMKTQNQYKIKPRAPPKLCRNSLWTSLRLPVMFPLISNVNSEILKFRFQEFFYRRFVPFS